MGKRIFLAGLLAGIGMYAWSSMAHIALPLGEAGIRQIPNEPGLLSSMQSTLGTSPGLYMFPAFGEGSRDMQQYEAKLASNPSGVLIYHPPGRKALTPAQLVTEFLTELIEAFLVVYLLAQTRLTSFASRWGFVTIVGVIAAIATNIPYWNWYGFPTTYTAAAITIQVVAFAVAGAIAAAILRPSPRTLAVPA